MMFSPAATRATENLRSRARTLSPSLATRQPAARRPTMPVRPETAPTSSRASFEVTAGKLMEYELMLPANYNPEVAIPFLVSVSGTGQQHVNGFSRRLVNEHWAVAVPLRPANAPLFFEGTGREGEGTWYLHRFVQHLSERFAVDTGKFLFVGVSNGGMSVLRFGTLWPELCRGLVVATGHLKNIATDTDLRRLQGLPIQMYVGTNDEIGMFPPMQELEAKLNVLGQAPIPELTVFPSAGHCCSPMIDTRLLLGKIQLMLFRSGATAGRMPIRIDSISDPLSRMPLDQVRAELTSFAGRLGLEYTADGCVSFSVSTDVAARAPTARSRAVSFAEGADISTHNELDCRGRQSVVRFTDEAMRAKSEDARSRQPQSARPRVASAGDELKLDGTSPDLKRARRDRAVSFADDTPNGQSTVQQTASSAHGRVPCQSPRQEPTIQGRLTTRQPTTHLVQSPVTPRVRPRCQTAGNVESVITDAQSATRQSQRRQTTHCAAEVVQRVAIAHVQPRLLVVR